jgi:hypothetical protein
MAGVLSTQVGIVAAIFQAASEGIFLIPQIVHTRIWTLVGGLTLGGTNQLSCCHFALAIALIAKYLKWTRTK